METKILSAAEAEDLAIEQQLEDYREAREAMQQAKDELARIEDKFEGYIPSNNERKAILELRRKLWSAFEWSSTPQGFMYWAKVDKNLQELMEYGF